MSFEQEFLQDVIKRFTYYKDLGDKTFDQLEELHFFHRPSLESNSISVIVQHLHGNMLSRWTNFLTEDGEKEWRKRDEEFEVEPSTKKKILTNWNDGWKCLFNTLESLTPEDLQKIVTIRTEPLTVYDAILRQLAHYPYHVGQIVYVGKMVATDKWQSLSIAKGKSVEFLQSVKMAYSINRTQ